MMRSRHGASSSSMASPQKQQVQEEDDELAPLVGPEHIRAGLQVVCALFSAFELYFWWELRWMPWVLLITNGWGWFDAVQRYPRPPDAESPFAMKQAVLLVVKIVCMAINIKKLEFEAFVFFGLIFWNLVLPLIYVLLLPDGQKPQSADSEEANTDWGLVALQLALQFTCSPRRQREWFQRTFGPRQRREWLQRTFAVAQAVPAVAKFTKLLLGDLSPKHRNLLAQKGRRVV